MLGDSHLQVTVTFLDISEPREGVDGEKFGRTEEVIVWLLPIT